MIILCLVINMSDCLNITNLTGSRGLRKKTKKKPEKEHGEEQGLSCA